MDVRKSGETVSPVGDQACQNHRARKKPLLRCLRRSTEACGISDALFFGQQAAGIQLHRATVGMVAVPGSSFPVEGKGLGCLHGRIFSGAEANGCSMFKRICDFFRDLSAFRRCRRLYASHDDAYFLAAVAAELGVGVQEARDGSWRKRFSVVDE